MAVRFLEVEMRRAPRLARGLALRHFASASPQASGVADDAIIRQFAARRQTGVSLRTLLDTGSGLLVNGQVRSGGAVPPEVLMRILPSLHHSRRCHQGAMPARQTELGSPAVVALEVKRRRSALLAMRREAQQTCRPFESASM